MSGIPVVIAANGTPVRRVYENAPLLTVASNGLGTPITITDLGAPFIIDGIRPPTPSTALDVVNSEFGGFTNFTQDFNLETDCAVFYLACEFRGDPVITITHGGEPLSVVSEQRTTESAISGRRSLALVAVGRGLSTESAPLVLSAAGGELDGGGFRIREMVNVADPSVGWTDQASAPSRPVSPVVVSSTSGGLIKGAFVDMTADRAHRDHVTNATEVMNSATVSGEAITNADTSTMGDWTFGAGWSRVGATLVHAGASQSIAYLAPPAQPNEFRALTFRATIGPNSWLSADSINTRLGEGEWESFGVYSGTTGRMNLTAFGDVTITETSGYYSARSLAWIFFSAPAVDGTEMDISMEYVSPWAWAVAEVMGEDSP